MLAVGLHATCQTQCALHHQTTAMRPPEEDCPWPWNGECPRVLGRHHLLSGLGHVATEEPVLSVRCLLLPAERIGAQKKNPLQIPTAHLEVGRGEPMWGMETVTQIYQHPHPRGEKIPTPHPLGTPT